MSIIWYIYTNNIYLCIYTYDIIIYTHNNHSYRGYIPPLQWLEWISIAMKITPGTLGRIPWYSPKISTSYEILWTISSLGFPCTGLLLPAARIVWWTSAAWWDPSKPSALYFQMARWLPGAMPRVAEWCRPVWKAGRSSRGQFWMDFRWNCWELLGFQWISLEMNGNSNIGNLN